MDEAEDLLNFRDMLADWLTEMRGTVTDRGYDIGGRAADLVVQSPLGPRIEITLRILEP